VPAQAAAAAALAAAAARGRLTPGGVGALKEALASEKVYCRVRADCAAALAACAGQPVNPGGAFRNPFRSLSIGILSFTASKPRWPSDKVCCRMRADCAAALATCASPSTPPSRSVVRRRVFQRTS